MINMSIIPFLIDVTESSTEFSTMEKNKIT